LSRFQKNKVDIDIQQDVALETLSGAPNYQAWLASLALPFFGSNPLEIGSGNGDYADLWRVSGVKNLTLNEVDANRLMFLKNRFAEFPDIDVNTLEQLDNADSEFSSCSSFNVLEHVENDVQLLERMSNWVKPGGHVFVLVPAFPFAYSEFDAKIGHFRRYTKKSLRRSMEDAGLVDVKTRYINPLGLIAWFILMKMLKGSPNSGLAVKIWDSTVIPVTRQLERLVKVPFGQSCIGVGLVDVKKRSH
jgi:SAM-dependent methyltransferase